MMSKKKSDLFENPNDVSLSSMLSSVRPLEHNPQSFAPNTISNVEMETNSVVHEFTMPSVNSPPFQNIFPHQ